MSRKFVRIYTDLPNEYPAIYDDAETLGTFVQLLMLPDRAYPMKPQVPRGIKDEPLERLVTAGLVILEDGDRYAIKGLVKLREAESEQGRRDIRKRWDRDPNRVPTRDPQTTRRDDTRRYDTNARAPARGEGAARGGDNGGYPFRRTNKGSLAS